MLDDHVHCGQCGRPILTQIKVAGGKTKPAQVTLGTQIAWAKGPDGIAPVERPVPLCPVCVEQIAEQQRQAASRLLVPRIAPA